MHGSQLVFLQFRSDCSNERHRQTGISSDNEVAYVAFFSPACIMPVAAPVHTALWQLRKLYSPHNLGQASWASRQQRSFKKGSELYFSCSARRLYKSQCAADAHIWCGTLSTGNSQCTYLLQMAGRWHVNTIVYWMTLDGTTWRMSMELVDLELIVMMLMWRPHGMQ